MNVDRDKVAIVRGYFEKARPRLGKLAGRFVEDVDPVIVDAEQIFEEMIPGLAYVNDPNNLMASALFICAVNLSLYLALTKRGVQSHQFGRAMLIGLTKAPVQPMDFGEGGEDAFAAFASEAEQQQNLPGEFVIEAVSGDGESFDWGYDVKSCAICHQFGKYDAMELVPYMCATDDVMSDKAEQGLQRSGSIAVGARRCDFRYTQGGTPKRLAEQFPQRIKVQTV